MNAPAVRKENVPAFAMTEDELLNVLRNSLYPGAQTDSIKMVVGYCKASGLDPMQKPVHIVPMWNTAAGRMIDVIMPGIGSYRTQAARSGEYAGVTEPEFGADVKENIGGVEIIYPSTCRVVVKRLLSNDTIAEFAATERWKENYAMKGGKEKSIAPNAMWTKRPYAQLAKCAEAQALRKAFPEFGAQPTADEMEGKVMEDAIEGSATVVKEPKKPEPLADEVFNKHQAGWKKSIVAGRKTLDDLVNFVFAQGEFLTDAQKDVIRSWVQEPAKVDDPFVAEMEAAERKPGEE